MPTKNHQVNQITEYLQAKIDTIKGKISAYEAPITQELLKSSNNMQMDLMRLKTQQESFEDILLAIQKFTTDEPKVPNKKNR